MKFKLLQTLLQEKNRHTRNLRPNSEEKRKGRAEDVKIVSIKKLTPSTAPEDKPLSKGWKLYEYEAISKEKTEGRTHSGYVVLDNNNNVKDVFCSCSDFMYMFRYALMNGDMASMETYPEYKDIERDAPFTGDPSHETNPQFKKMLCKHLIRIFEELDI